MSETKLDVFAHVLPRAYLDALIDSVSDRAPFKRWLELPMLHDIDARLRVMEQWPGYKQLLSLSSPPPDAVPDPRRAAMLARIANDEMAALVAAHPERFPAFVASLPMSDPDAAVLEGIRAIDDLGAVGAQIYTNVGGLPLDDPRFLPVFELFAARRCPLWLHPARPGTFSDYAAEPASRYEIWWALGWPYETTAAMARLVFSGILDRLPDLEVITHHMGGLAPFLEGRLALGWDQIGSRTSGEDLGAVLARLDRRPVDYFRDFHADTATFGSSLTLRAGLEFFGVEKSLFATDFPFDGQGGRLLIAETIAAVEGLELTEEQRTAIFSGNAERLLGEGVLR